MSLLDDGLPALLKTQLNAARNKEGAANALTSLFPKAKKALGALSMVREEGRSRRLHEHEYAASYFRLDPQPSTWSKAEIAALLIQPPDEIFRSSIGLIERSPDWSRGQRRRLLLDELMRHFDDSPGMGVDWLLAISSAAPYFIKAGDIERRSLVSFSNLDRLRWLLANGLKKLDPEERASRIMQAAPIASDLTALSAFVRIASPDLNEEGGKADSDDFGFGSYAPDVRRTLVEKIKKLVSSGQFWSQAKPDQILWFWWASTNGDEPREFVQEQLSTVEGARNIFPWMLSVVESTGGSYEHVSLSSWSKLADIGMAEKRAHDLAASGDESDVRLGQRLILAIEKGRSSRF